MTDLVLPTCANLNRTEGPGKEEKGDSQGKYCQVGWGGSLGLVWVWILETKAEISTCCIALSIPWVQVMVAPGLNISIFISGITVRETHSLTPVLKSGTMLTFVCLVGPLFFPPVPGICGF